MRGTSPTVTATNHLVFSRDSVLWAVPVRRDTLEAVGEEVPVLAGVDGSLLGPTLYGLSRDGTLVYVRRLERAAPLERFNQAGETTGTLGSLFEGTYHFSPRFSPDGAFVAVCRHPVGGGDQVVVYDLRRGGVIAIGGGDSRNPVWSPDGTRLTFTSTRNGTMDIFEITANLGRDAQPLLVKGGVQVPLSWTPDGSALAFSEGTLRNADIWILRRGGEASPLLANPAYSENDAAFSTDGKYLAYSSTESGRQEVYVQGYPTATGRLRVSTNGGRGPAWTRDGLYFEDLDGSVFFVRSDTAGIEPTATPQRVSSVPLAIPSPEGRAWDVTADGQSFVVGRNYAPPTGVLELVFNWHEELKRLSKTRAGND